MSRSLDVDEPVEILLETLTYGGAAMGRLADGRAVFVPFGLPGERVRIRLTGEKRNFARGEIVQIMEASPERIVPRCRHYGVCGGCHYQHTDYDHQLRVKEWILRDQLTRIGKIENPPVKPVVGSPSPWNYRNHAQFHLTAEGQPGYLTAGDHAVFAVEECHLPEEPINSFWPLLDFEPQTETERVSIRSGSDELMLVLESSSPEPPALEVEAAVSIVHLFDTDPVILAGNDAIFMQILERDFRVSAGSFFQVNTAMAGKMVEHLLARLPLSGNVTLLDIYCGAGLFSAFLAPLCGRVVGIESSAAACEDFSFNLSEFENVELYEAAAEVVIPHLDLQPEIVLVDPPRAGLDVRVVDGLLNLQPGTIAYVSCDPSTLARDAARLIRGGYRLSEVTPFDLFPQTYHIESISLFER